MKNLLLPYQIVSSSQSEAMISLLVDEREVKLILSKTDLAKNFISVKVLSKAKDHYSVEFPGCVIGGEKKMNISLSHNLFVMRKIQF